MKIEIEKVQKVKTFEPFIVKIQFDTPDEARKFLQRRVDNINEVSEGVHYLFDRINNELRQQGYVTYYNDGKSS